MTALPIQKTKGARTGSNIRGNPLRAQQTKLLAQHDRAYAPLVREQQRQRKKLFSKTELRLATRIADEINGEFRAASLTVGGSAARVAALKRAARQKLERQLARTFPDFRNLQTLQRQYIRELTHVAETLHSELPRDRVHIDWGNLVDAVGNWEEFTAPFGYFASDTFDSDRNVRADHSFAVPEHGYVVNNFIFKQDENTPIILGLYGLIRAETASNQTSCGIRYTVPKPGRLQLSGSFQNYESGLRYSIDDRFGFSSATLDARVELFVALVRPSGVTYLPTTLFEHRLDSDGDDKSYVMPHLNPAQFYTVYATSAETFGAGDSVQIMIGSAVNIGGVADDMINEVHAYFEWRLDKITVEVV